MRKSPTWWPASSTLVTAYSLSQSERDRLSEPGGIAHEEWEGHCRCAAYSSFERARDAAASTCTASRTTSFTTSKKKERPCCRSSAISRQRARFSSARLTSMRVGSLDGVIDNQLPLRLVFATVAEPDIVGGLLGVSEDKYELLFESSLGGE